MNGPSYRFRLERVRALRERREEQAKQSFAEALEAHERCGRELRNVQETIVNARRAQLEASADTLGAHQSYLERLERSEQLCRQRLAAYEASLDEARAALTKASQELEALERLKEKGLAEHTREASRLEQLLLDEIAGNGHWRRAA